MYNISLNGFSKDIAFNYIPIPCLANEQGNDLMWNSLSQLATQGIRYLYLFSEPKIQHRINSVSYIPLNDFNLKLCEDKTIMNFILSVIRTSSIIRLQNKELLYEIKPFGTPFKRLSDSHHYTSSFDWKYYQVYGEELMDYLCVCNLAQSMNYNHPVTQFINDSRNMITDRYKWFRWGIENVVRYLAHNKNFDEKQPIEWSKETLGNVNTIVSHWKKVKWNELPEEIKPPYKIYFHSSGKSHDISLETLVEMINKAGNKETPPKIGLTNLD